MRIDKIQFCIVVLFSCFLAGCILPTPVLIEGMAMRPTFDSGDRALFSRNFKEVNRGDVIWFLAPVDKRKHFIKRVIGLPNENVEIREGKVFINGSLIEEPYIDSEYNRVLDSFAEIEIPADSYFVMGDNRDNSSDSRSWGTVKKELILGKYFVKYASAKE